MARISASAQSLRPVLAIFLYTVRDDTLVDSVREQIAASRPKHRVGHRSNRDGGIRPHHAS